MSRVRPALGRVVRLALGWAVAVTVLASLTFVVVDLADQVVGQGVAAGVPGVSDDAPTVRAGGRATTGTTAPGTGPRASGGTSGPGSSGDPTGDDPTSGPSTGGSTTPGRTSGSRPSGGATSGPTGTTGPGGTSGPGATNGPGTPTTSAPDPTTEPPAPTPSPTPTRVASFTTDGGTATVECKGKAVRIQAVTARDGWRFQERTVASRGKATITFSRTADTSYVEIDVTCVGGKPEKTGLRKGKGQGNGNGGNTRNGTTAPDASTAIRDPRG